MFLAIDTSSKNISLAISKRGKVIADFNKLKAFGSSSIVAELDKVLKKYRLKLKDFKAFIVGYGPGSFTGLRISYAVVKALAIVFNKPVIAVSSFDSMARPFFQKYKNIVVITDARKGLIYWVKFVDGVMKNKERLTVLDEALEGNSDSFFITYDHNIRTAILAKNDKLKFNKDDIYPRAQGLFASGIDSYNSNKYNSLTKLEPLYLHPKDCQVRK